MIHFTIACWTILSSSAAIPSGRVPPSGLGIFTRLLGVARNDPRCTRVHRSSIRFSKSVPYTSHVMPSTPGDADRFNAKYAAFSESTLMWCRSVVSFSFGFRCTNPRIRSIPWCTRAHFCAWCVVGSPEFPSRRGLRSTSSADGSLFAGFCATIPLSDFSISCILGYDVFRLP